MKKQKKEIKKQRPNSSTAMIIASIMVILIAVFLITQKPTTVTVIEDSSDLNKISTGLDNTDMSQFDDELKKLDADVATF